MPEEAKRPFKTPLSAGFKPVGQKRNLQKDWQPRTAPGRQGTDHPNNLSSQAETYEEYVALKEKAERARADAMSLEVQRYNEASFLGNAGYVQQSTSSLDVSVVRSTSARPETPSPTDIIQTSVGAESQTTSEEAGSGVTIWDSPLLEPTSSDEVIHTPMTTLPQGHSKMLYSDLPVMHPAIGAMKGENMKTTSIKAQVSLTHDPDHLRKQEILSMQQLKQWEAFRGSQDSGSGQSG